MEAIRSGALPRVSAQEKQLVQVQFDRMKKTRDSRKRKCMDVIGLLEDGSGKKRAVLMVGISC